MELPGIIPLFPLPNAVLFPGVMLPLHIFEERYRDMVRDAEASEDKLIGMTLLRGDWQESYYEQPEIFAVGCAGRMVRCERLDDGRYNILLQGVREFEICRELGDSSYRQADVAWRETLSEDVPEVLSNRVRALTAKFLETRDPELARRLLDDASMSKDLLVNFLSYSLDCTPVEKQALLESRSLDERATRLCDTLEFALGGGGFDAGGSVH